jgi:hypothetical protein
VKLDHQLVARTVVLGAWGAFFAWLWLSEQGVRFVGPRTYWVIPFDAVLVLSATLGHLILLHRTTGTGGGSPGNRTLNLRIKSSSLVFLRHPHQPS